MSGPEHVHPEDAQFVRLTVEAAIAELGTSRAFAAWAGISEGNLTDYRKGRRMPPLKLLAALGLRKVIHYESATP